MTYGKWNASGSLTFADGDVLTASNINTSFTICPPIGAIMGWHKSFSNTPSLQEGWVECNGQTLSDSDSPYNGQTIPDLNGSSGSQRFLYGDTTSGTTGGVGSHLHIWSTTPASGNTYGLGYSTVDYGSDASVRSYNSAGTLENISNTGTLVRGTHYTQKVNNTPPHFTVVWIMRVK